MIKRKTKKIKLMAFLLALAFALSPVSFLKVSPSQTKAEENNGSSGRLNPRGEEENEEIVIPEDAIIIDQNTTWKKTDGIVIDSAVVVRNNAILTIEAGTIVRFRKKENALPPFLYVDGGLLYAPGTESEKIAFTSDQEDSGFSLIFNSHINSSWSGWLRYVEISKAGGEYEIQMPADPPAQTFLPSFLPFVATKALAEETTIQKKQAYPVRHLGGFLRIENSRFFDNKNADVYLANYQIDPADLDDFGGRLVDLVGNNFENNTTGIAVRADYECFFSQGTSVLDCENILRQKNNYYGKLTGPYIIRQLADYYLEHKDEYDSDENFGAKVVGKFAKVDSFKSKSLIADPLLVIPGIMGSAGIGDSLVLDPILHTYDNLVSSLEKNGYEKNINLLEFPYEWRNSNVVTAEKLQEKISEITENDGLSRVDLLAHSMGGLVARYYIESPDYQYDVDQLVTLGTPHKGSPKAYLNWEAAEGFLELDELVAKGVFTLEAHALDYDDLKEYIQARVKSAQELLPDYDYLFDVTSEEMRIYPDDYPRNSFLEYLNNEDYLANLSNVNFTNIVGNVDDREKTIEKFRVTDSIEPEKWEHGMPENFYDNTTDRGIERGEGDETVPLSSAKGVSANKEIELNSKHGDLPTKAQCNAFKELTGKADCEYVGTLDRIISILTFGVFSPIDIQIVAPDGKRVGKNFQTGEIINEIPNAYYTGSETENEFLTIPNPIDGEYKILTQGTGEGAFKVEATKISEDAADTSKAIESKAEVTGTAALGQEQEFQVAVDGDEVTTDIKDTTPPIVEITSPKEQAYRNNQILEIQYSASDNETSADKIKTQIFFDGNLLETNKIDLSLQHLGSHEISAIAEDESENKSSETKVNFEVTTDIHAIMFNVRHYYDLKLISDGTTKHALEMRLRMIDRSMGLLEIFENKKMPKWAKDKVVGNLKRDINREINWLIREIQHQKKFKKTISQQAKEFLVESLEAIKIK